MRERAADDKNKYLLFLLAALFVLIADQASKWALQGLLAPGGSVTIIPGLFDLVNIRNRGAAFGFLNRSDMEWQFWLFLAATLIAACAIFAMVRGARKEPLLVTALGLILGGAIGNLVDRIRYRAVVDFLDLYWHDWHWPAFNIADTGICVGAFLACAALWRKHPENKA